MTTLFGVIQRMLPGKKAAGGGAGAGGADADGGSIGPSRVPGLEVRDTRERAKQMDLELLGDDRDVMDNPTCVSLTLTLTLTQASVRRQVPCSVSSRKLGTQFSDRALGFNGVSPSPPFLQTTLSDRLVIHVGWCRKPPRRRASELTTTPREERMLPRGKRAAEPYGHTVRLCIATYC